MDKTLKAVLNLVETRTDRHRASALAIANRIKNACEIPSLDLNHEVHWNATDLIVHSAKHKAGEMAIDLIKHVDNVPWLKERMTAILVEKARQLVNCSNNRIEPIEREAEVEFLSEVVRDLEYYEEERS